MEKPPESIALPRALAAVLLAACCAAAYLETLSPAARAVRAGQPYLCWVAVEKAKPLLFLAVYRPAMRSLDLLYFPESGPSGRKKRISGPAESARAAQEWLGRLLPPNPSWPPVLVRLASGDWPEDDPPAALKSWILRNASGLPFWRGLPALARSAQDIPLAERFFLALELHRVSAERIRPSWLPEESFAPVLLARLLAPTGEKTSALGRPITAEVLNATGQKGVASQATKILRLNGVDVVFTGNAEPRAQTAVYDRAGRFETAERVAALLGCPESAAQTQVNLKKLVDVTVVLAVDCDISGSGRKLWSLLRY